MSGVQFSNNSWQYVTKYANNRPATAAAPTAYLDATTTQAPAADASQSSILKLAFTLFSFAAGNLLQSLFGAGTSEATSSTNLSDNGSIQQRANQLLGSNPALLQLFNQSANLDPESPQAQQTTQQLAQAMQQAGYSARDIKEVFILKAGLDINNQIASLMQVASNLDPEGPEAQQIQANLSSLQDTKSQLQQRLSQLSQSSGFANRDIQPTTLPQADFDTNSQVASLMQVASNLDPESPEAQQIQANLNGLQGTNSQVASLMQVASNLDPESPEAQQIQANLNGL